VLRRLEALLVVSDREHGYIISGSGELIEPDDGVLAIGSGGSYALASARALLTASELPAKDIVQRSLEIAAEICVYTTRTSPFWSSDGRADPHTPRQAAAAPAPEETLPWLEELAAPEDRGRAGPLHRGPGGGEEGGGDRGAQPLAPLAGTGGHPRRDHANNIIMIGPTGVGKTEIARRLARLAGAPFLKVEASKFTEVGYVGRDVESMVRELVDVAINMVRTEREDDVYPQAEARAEERLLDLLLRPRRRPPSRLPPPGREPGSRESERESALVRGLVQGRCDAEGRGRRCGGPGAPPPHPVRSCASTQGGDARGARGRNRGAAQGFPRAGDDAAAPGHGGPGRQFHRAAAGNAAQEEKAPHRAPARGAAHPGRRGAQEARRHGRRGERVARPRRNHGVIFIDEIDKIAGERGTVGPDVSREGVQRDLLPIVEGSTVQTRYGFVRTDHILFIAAGAFHATKPSDLIPELQGRFPIRVELQPLTEADFVRIMTEPENALTKQLRRSVRREGATLEFTHDGIKGDRPASPPRPTSAWRTSAPGDSTP